MTVIARYDDTAGFLFAVSAVLAASTRGMETSIK